MQEIEFNDGGCIEYPDDDGEIRRRDCHGNCEEVRYPEDDNWQEWADLFPQWKKKQEKTLLDELESLVCDYDINQEFLTGNLIKEICANLSDLTKEEKEQYNHLVQDHPWVFEQVGYGVIE